jgi:DNA invertase Pin-like site-specific DNA recombinase
VIYLRVSTAEQAEKDAQTEGYSIPAQREACIRRAEQMEVKVVDEYADQGESARSADRPALQAMLERLETRRDVDYVIVHKVDRLARNRLDDVTISLHIREAGAQLVSVSESIDETPSGELLHAIMAANAEFFSKNLALETKKGLRQKFRTGGTVGRAPLGYLNVGHHVGGTEVRGIEFDPERAPLIQWAFETYATGRWTLSRLCDELTARGLTTRPSRKGPAKPISTSTLGNILVNRYYIGFVRYEGAEVPGNHEPLVEPEVFAKVQRVLKAHARSGENDRKHHHYLKGTLYCGRCGSRLILTHARGQRGGIYPYFFCIGRQQRNGCRQPYEPVAVMEQAVERLYETVQVSAGRAKVIEAELLARLDKREKQIQKEARRARQRSGKLDDERTKLVQAHLAGAVPLEVLRREQARLTTAIEGAQRAIAAAERQSENDAHNIKQAVALGTDTAKAYRQAPADVRRLFNQAFFTRLAFRDAEISEVELTEPYAQMLANDLMNGTERPTAAGKSNGQRGVAASQIAVPDREPDFVLSGPGSSYEFKGRSSRLRFAQC